MEKQIVILGAGYGGLTVAQQLGRALGKRSKVQIVLVDANDYHELKPKIPEAVGEWTDCAVQVPIRDALADYPAIRFVQAKVTGLDRVARQVITSAGPIPYWRLVWALGGQPDFAPMGMPIPGLAEVAIAPYTFPAACRLRRKIGSLVKQAATLPAEERAPLLTIVVAGGGFVGVELAGELADRLSRLSECYGLPPNQWHVVLLEPRAVLVGFDPRLARSSVDHLRAKSVDVRLGAELAEAHPDHAVLSNGATIPCATIVWAGGIRGNPLASALELPVDGKGRILVDAHLKALAYHEIYALGDGVRCDALERRRELANSGQAATSQGRAIARSLLAELRGKTAQPYQPETRGVVVLVGNREALARVGRFAPLRRVAPWLKQVPLIEHLWQLGGLRLVARHVGSTVLPLIAPGRVNRYAHAGDAPVTEGASLR